MAIGSNLMAFGFKGFGTKASCQAVKQKVDTTQPPSQASKAGNQPVPSKPVRLESTHQAKPAELALARV